MKGFLAWVLFVAIALTAWGRPVDLSPPGNGLGSASSEGSVSFYIDLATLDFKNGLQLPLRIDFNSASQNVSPYVGALWRCVLLEAIAIQTREDAIDACLLCGKHLHLYRSKKDITQYWDRNHEWQGELKGNVLRVFRDDKWELTYINGRLTTLKTDTGRVLNWQWTGKAVTAITEGGRGGIFEVKFDPTTKLATAFLVNDKEYRLELTQPQEFGPAPSLTKLTWPDGRSESFALDTTGKECELVTTDNGNEKRYTWDYKTRYILSDGEWTYQVGEVKSQYERPPLSRKNREGETESYFYEASKGISTSQALDGTITKQYFVKSAGPNYMHLRKVERTKNGATTVIYRAGFDESARVIRETEESGKVTLYQYDAAGNQISAIQDGKPLWKREYDLQKRLIMEESCGAMRATYRYLEDGNMEEVRFRIKPTSRGDDEVVAESKEVVLRDRQGWPTLKRDAAGNVWEYKRDDHGRAIEEKLNGSLYQASVYNSVGKLKERILHGSDGKLVEQYADDGSLIQTSKPPEDGSK